MPSVRGEITRTLLRLSKLVDARPESDPSSESAPKPPRRKQILFSQGTEFGPYIVGPRLGAGGMGQVYLATDRRLKRKVALKFLSPELVSDSASLRRLRAEAETASALNHPNILTIYEVGELEGLHYIASEYVEGVTLRSAMNKKSIDVQSAIDVICQALSALSAAHAAGVVHRDLKPGNIMIRPDGYAKVIDFGLAKRTRRNTPEISGENSLTRPGLVVGTVYYMSPEQACGDTVDHRTDIWSLGIILFEVVTHRRPFDDESESRVVRNICSKPLPAIPASESLPAGLVPVIERALRKEPEERYSSAREMLDELSTVGFGTRSGSRTIRAAKLNSRGARRWVLPGLAALVVLTAVCWLAWSLFHPQPNWFQVERVRQLTFNGHAILSAISPDGKYVAYTAGDLVGSQTVYLTQTDGGNDVVKVPPRKTRYIGLSFAPDDQLFAVAKSDEELVGRAYEIPVLGDPVEKALLVDVDGPLAFSPDGKQIAFVRRTPNLGPARNLTESAIFLASRDGSQVRKLISKTDKDFLIYLDWSPQGNRLATVTFQQKGRTSGKATLDLIDLQGHERNISIPDWQLFGRLNWDADGRSILMTASERDEAAAQAQLRQIDLQTGAVHSVTKEISGFQSPCLTQNGTRLALIKVESQARLWVSDVNKFDGGSDAWAESERRPSLDWIDDGRVLVGSMRGGFPNLWSYNIASKVREPLTRESYAEQEAKAIPGTRDVVFVSKRSGQAKLWIFQSDSNAYRQLTFGPDPDETPFVTKDGKSVFYTSWSGLTPHLFRVASAGGNPEQIAPFSAKLAAVSPDGASVACRIPIETSGRWNSVIFSVNDPEHYRLIPPMGFGVQWSPDNRSLSEIRNDARGVSNIWDVPVDGRQAQPVTHFADWEILKFAWSASGNRLACLRSSSVRDVMLYVRK